MLPRIYLIRHGETEWSRSGQHTGLMDIPLTAHGENQAEELGKRLRDISFTRVFTSPRRRARRTSELAGFAPVAESELDLAEWNYGDYEGKRSMDILKERPDWNLFCDGCPGGESPAQVSARADRFIARLRGLEGNVALFSHGHFGRVLAARWMGLSVAQAQHLVLNTGSLSVLGYEHNRVEYPAIVLWNLGLNGISDITPKQRIADNEALAGKRAIERWENEGGEILTENKATNNLFRAGDSTADDRFSRLKVRIIQADSSLPNLQTFGSSTISPISPK